RQRDRFFLPATETKKRADPEPAKSRLVTAVRAIEAPVEIAFRSGGVQFAVRFAVIGFLVNDEAFRAGFDDRNVVRRFHWPDFDRDRREIRRERAHAIGQIILADEFRMFARDKENMT